MLCIYLNTIIIKHYYSAGLPSLVCVCPASAGSDSPDQALEAEEMVAQLDIEPAVETPTSTVTSTPELCATTNLYSSLPQQLPPPLRPPHIPEVSPTAGEGELQADADLPPLTGKTVHIEKSKNLQLPCIICVVSCSCDSSARLHSRYGLCGRSSYHSTTRGNLRGRLGGL